jgi:putative CocE/NonD family hydrolase
MTFSHRAAMLTAPFLLLSSALAQTAQYPNMPSEMPATVNVPADLADYTRRVVMIPMRDGVKLNTVILVPKTATVEHKAAIVLTRTPYSAVALTTNAQSTHLASSLEGYDNATDVIIQGGYIRVVQDVRGKYGSEGDYVMNRPFKGPLNPTPVDHSTDTYDTIDWLIKNVPETNGKVGIIGISYDGFTTLAALINPHPALKVAVPMNPMVDGWRGDDWFHNGAFRQQNELYIYEQDGSRSNDFKWPTSTYDDYAMFMRATSAGNLAKQRGLDQMGFWRKVVAHPAYDAFWQEQAMDKLLAAQYAKQAPTLPIMLVHSLWDAEDIYGAMAVYKAIKPLDKNNMVYLSMGPWHHGGAIDDGSSLGMVKFPTDPSYWWRQNVLAPFLAKYLQDEASTYKNALADPAWKQEVPEVSPVTVYESGTNHWKPLQSWPRVAATSKIYLHSDGRLNFTTPAAAEGTTAYVSDPAKPVNYRPRPSRTAGYEPDNGWANWLAGSQMEQSGRPDVAVFTTDVLTAPVTIAGEPIANLVAATTGSDSDWVVKLIDVYPDEVSADPKMGGYQLMIAADIFRGRYRESLSEAHPIPANQPELYRFALPNASHVFLPGHRIMVQVQSSWFPLYDRNPQTFVPNIFFAQPADYKAATQTIFHSASQPSFIELPLVQ